MKRVLITGANRGIGFALTAGCAARGDRIFATCREPEAATRLVSLGRQYPEQISLHRLDVSDETQIAGAAREVDELTPALDLLINNAAVHFGDVSLSKVQAGVLLETLKVNVVGPILVAKHFRSPLSRGDNPKLINISSEAGSISKMTHFRGYAYYGSKAAVNMLSRSLAFDPEMEGIITAAVHPGWVRTDMGGSKAHLSPEESAEGVLKVIDQLTPAENGKFFTWQGLEHPW